MYDLPTGAFVLTTELAVFCRNHEFNFTGRCIVSLSTTEDARRLIEYGHRRVLGGNTLKINYVSVCWV